MSIVLALASASAAFGCAWFAPRVPRWVRLAGALLLVALLVTSVVLSLRQGMASPWSGVTSGLVLGFVLGFFTRPHPPVSDPPPAT